MRDLISVIVPIYNVETYLDECVNSIVNQTYTNLEIILVDDGSPDNCPAMCDKWKEKDNRIKVIHKENGGLSDARNAGLEIATGEYIGFVDSDDWIEEDMYEKLYASLIEENADVCACGLIYNYSDRVVKNKALNIKGSGIEIYKYLYDDTKYIVAAWNKLYKKQCWNELKFPKGKICEDAFTTYMIIHNANRIIQIEDSLYHYRIRENSIMTSNFKKSKMDEEEAWRVNYQFMKKYYPEVAQKAFDFYLQKVNMLIHTIKGADKEIFNKEYLYLKDILKRNCFYILLKSNYSFKYRMKYLLEYIKL